MFSKHHEKFVEPKLARAFSANLLFRRWFKRHPCRRRDRQSTKSNRHTYQARHNHRWRNRSFDHLFATYVPKNQEDDTHLLSDKINLRRRFTPARISPSTPVPDPLRNPMVSSTSHAILRTRRALQPRCPAPGPRWGGFFLERGSPYVGILSLPGGDPGLCRLKSNFSSARAAPGFPVQTGSVYPHHECPITCLPGTCYQTRPFRLQEPKMPSDASPSTTIPQYLKKKNQKKYIIAANACASTRTCFQGEPTGGLHYLSNLQVTTTYSTPPTQPRTTPAIRMAVSFNLRRGDAAS